MAEAARKSQTLKNALNLRAGPLGLLYEGSALNLQITGIVGSLHLFGVRVEILPKFGDDRSWHDNVMMLLARAHGARFDLQELRGTDRDRLSFVDHVAQAFSTALDAGLLDGPIETYRDIMHRAPVAKGRIDIPRTVTAALRSPGSIFSWTSELDADNPYNRVLHAAADILLQLVTNRDVRVALQRSRDELPPLPGGLTPPVRWPDRPPLQFAGYAEALEIASAVLQGRDWGIGSAANTAFGYVVGMEKLFEKFVESSLRQAVKLLPSSLGASPRSQARTLFAQPLTPRRKAYFTTPDNVVDVQGRPTIIVDAKYKRFADAETGDAGRPSNADVYQMFASMAAHGCRAALLIYPSSDALKGTPPIWRMKVGMEGAFVMAAGLPISTLRTRTDLDQVDQALAQHCKNLLELVHEYDGDTPSVA